MAINVEEFENQEARLVHKLTEQLDLARTLLLGDQVCLGAVLNKLTAAVDSTMAALEERHRECTCPLYGSVECRRTRVCIGMIKRFSEDPDLVHLTRSEQIINRCT